MKWNRDKLPTLAGLLVAVPAVIMVCSLHWFFVRAPPANIGFDDGYTVALGERLIDGHWLPYVDGCSHRGPFLYWVVALAQKLSGRFNWAGPRWLMLLVSLTTVGGLVGTGFAARLPLAGGLASMAFVLLALVAHPPESAFAVTGEAIAAALGILAVCAVAWALLRDGSQRRRRILLALAGCFVALAGMTKQTAFPMAVPIGLWVAAAAFSLDGLEGRQRWGLVIAFALGLCAVILIVILRYLIAGELKTFWYWFYTYNADVYMAPYRDTPLREPFDRWLRGSQLFFCVVGLAGMWGVVRWISEIRTFPRGLLGAYASVGLEATASLLTLISFVAMASPQRYFPPYFILVYPFVALVVGIVTAKIAERGQGTFAARLTGSLVLASSVAIGVGYSANLRLRDLVTQRKAGQWQAALPEPICDFFDQYSGPDDSVFIWGFDGDFYVTCHRHPATRFTYLTLVAGTVPPFWDQKRNDRIARDARKNLMADLIQSRPLVVLDAPGTMRDISLMVMPELVKYLRENYCKMQEITSKDGRKAKAWVRRDRVSCNEHP